MSVKNTHIRILSYCACILLMFCLASPVYAADVNLELKLSNLTLESNGEYAKWETVKKNGHIILNTDTTGLEKGYYTTQIAVKDKMDWTPYGEISFYIKNLSSKSIKINFFAILKDGTYLTVDSEKFVLLQKENYEYLNLLNPQDGLFQLSDDFDGTVHIPFENFKGDINNLRDIVSFGITTTTEENIIQKIEIGNLKLISEPNLSIPKELLGLQVVGDKNITKPIVGESVAQYNLTINNGQESVNKNKVSFYLMEEVEGVSITEEGRLTVTTKANAEKVNVKAVINSKLNIVMEVFLSDSLVLNLKDAQGFSLAVPKVQEVQKVINSQDIFNGEDMLIVFRTTIGVVIAIITMFYFIWRRKWKKQSGT